MDKLDFTSKDEARTYVWDKLQDENQARFPFPPHGRIPNFKNARQAAERLLKHLVWEGVETVKINPDAPQRFVRILCLERGIKVLVPTPRLRGGFKLLNPEKIPNEQLKKAASLSHMDRWAEQVSLDEIPSPDLIVAGSVAVTRTGNRCGKGEGYSDLEYAILIELGHKPVPVVTTVHPLQLVNSFPTDPHDLHLSLIATPNEIIDVDNQPKAPKGISWEQLSDKDLEEMPILKELKNSK